MKYDVNEDDMSTLVVVQKYYKITEKGRWDLGSLHGGSGMWMGPWSIPRLAKEKARGIWDKRIWWSKKKPFCNRLLKSVVSALLCDNERFRPHTRIATNEH